jgi:tetratricopeptide (TPR) repeat protein
VQTAKAAMLLCLTVATGLGSWYLRVQIPGNQWRRQDEAGLTSMDQQRFVEAERQFATAVETARSFGDRDPRLAQSLFHLAQALAAQAKYTEAIPLLEQSAAIKQTILGPDHNDVALVLEHYAAALRKSGRVDEALAVETRAGMIEHKFDQR